MSTSKDRLIIPGSERTSIREAREAGPSDPNERIEVTVIIRPRISPQTTAEEIGQRPIDERSHLSREEFEASHGASPEDISKIRVFAQEYGLDIVDANTARRSVVLAGTAAQFSEAFGVRLSRYELRGGSYRGRTGPISIPTELSSIVQAVLGLDDRPQARPHFRPSILKKSGYTPPQVAKLYSFPPGLDGNGQCIGIIELGGGSKPEDLDAYFQSLGIPTPDIISIPVDGASNNPIGNPNSDDGEVMLDIEVAGSVAPAARIAVYYAPNNDRGFLDAITTAIHDSQNKPSVISISWGQAESSWTQQAIQAFDQVFQEAALLGVTVCVASGDGGSSDGETDNQNHVDFPASSPHVLACGGTTLESNGTIITNEKVWNDLQQGGGASGGGVSDIFPLPQWQVKSKVPTSTNIPGTPKRGVPDVSGNADPATGYVVQVDGTPAVIGGTSAVAPLWAALIVLFNQRLAHSTGYLNPILYNNEAGTPAFHDITTGNNGSYHAHRGWDACTGLGSPNGAELLTRLTPKVVATMPA